MKKIISVLLLITLVFTLLFSMISCGDSEEPIEPNNPDRVNGDDVPEWNDPSLNPEGGVQFRPVPLPSN